jgi:hypothetical protein
MAPMNKAQGDAPAHAVVPVRTGGEFAAPKRICAGR